MPCALCLGRSSLSGAGTLCCDTHGDKHAPLQHPMPTRGRAACQLCYAVAGCRAGYRAV